MPLSAAVGVKMDLHPPIATLKNLESATTPDQGAATSPAPVREPRSNAPTGEAGRDERSPPSNADAFPSVEATEADPGHVPDPGIAALAESLLGPLDLFLERLNAAIGSEIGVAGPNDSARLEIDDDGEAQAFEDIALDVVVCGAAPAIASITCATLAARTIARAVAGRGALDRASGEALLSSWIETARAVASARGREGLLRLLPTARRLAHRCDDQGDRVASIAAAMRRVAARIAADSDRGRPTRRAPRRRDSEGARAGAAMPRRRGAFEGQEELMLRAR